MDLPLPSEEALLLANGLEPLNYACVRVLIVLGTIQDGGFPVSDNGNAWVLMAQVVVPKAAFKTLGRVLTLKGVLPALDGMVPSLQARLMVPVANLQQPPLESQRMKFEVKLPKELVRGADSDDLQEEIRRLLAVERLRDGRIGIAEAAVLCDCTQDEIQKYAENRGCYFGDPTPEWEGPPLGFGLTATLIKED